MNRLQSLWTPTLKPLPVLLSTAGFWNVFVYFFVLHLVEIQMVAATVILVTVSEANPQL